MAAEDMDLLEIVQFVYRGIREIPPTSLSSQTTRTKEVIDAIKDVYEEICSLNEGHLSFLEADGTITLVESTREYALATDLKDLNIEGWIMDNTTILDYVDYSDFLEKFIDKTEEGAPIDFSIWNNQAVFGYVPDSAYATKVVKYSYWKRPDELVDATDLPLVPKEFRKRTICNGAMSRILQMDGDPSFTMKEAIYQKGIKDLKRGYSSIEKNKAKVNFIF